MQWRVNFGGDRLRISDTIGRSGSTWGVMSAARKCYAVNIHVSTYTESKWAVEWAVDATPTTRRQPIQRCIFMLARCKGDAPGGNCSGLGWTGVGALACVPLSPAPARGTFPPRRMLRCTEGFSITVFAIKN